MQADDGRLVYSIIDRSEAPLHPIIQKMGEYGTHIYNSFPADTAAQGGGLPNLHFDPAAGANLALAGGYVAEHPAEARGGLSCDGGEVVSNVTVRANYPWLFQQYQLAGRHSITTPN